MAMTDREKDWKKSLEKINQEIISNINIIQEEKEKLKIKMINFPNGRDFPDIKDNAILHEYDPKDKMNVNEKEINIMRQISKIAQNRIAKKIL
ncbi:MAG: hypothetical protein SO022_07700 [Selenomonadaceae bacterium]|nr:hypothetical protein [Selenomonadaceae bacterium]